MPSQYDIFCKVVETGSFTRAAQLLGYSQSAVSQAVKALERELGTTLVSRGKGGVVLTQDGESYLPYIRAVNGAEQALERKRRELEGLENSTIRIGTFTTVSRNLLPQLMQRFKKRYPGVHFVLQQGEYTSINRWVREGNVDFGFTNLSTASGLTAQPLYQDEMVAVLPLGHPLASRKMVTMEQLASQPLILLDEGASSVAMETFSDQGFTPQIEYQVYDDYSILAMVRQGLGISILYRLVLPGFEERVTVRPIVRAPQRTVALAWRDWETMPLSARRFADFILRHAQELLEDLLRQR